MPGVALARPARRWLPGRRAARRAAGHGLGPGEVTAILELFEEWGDVDRSHRKLAHRGSYTHTVWVSPATVRRVLAAHGLVLVTVQSSGPAPACKCTGAAAAPRGPWPGTFARVSRTTARSHAPRPRRSGRKTVGDVYGARTRRGPDPPVTAPDPPVLCGFFVASNESAANNGREGWDHLNQALADARFRWRAAARSPTPRGLRAAGGHRRRSRPAAPSRILPTAPTTERLLVLERHGGSSIRTASRSRNGRTTAQLDLDLRRDALRGLPAACGVRGHGPRDPQVDHRARLHCGDLDAGAGRVHGWNGPGKIGGANIASAPATGVAAANP